VTYGAGSLWTANYGQGTVSRVNPVTHRVVKTIGLGNSPFAIAFADGSVWVGDFNADYVYRVDPATNKSVAAIPLSSNVGAIAHAPDGSIWVTEYAGGALDRIDPATNTVVQHIVVGGSADKIAFAAAKVWVTNDDGYVTPVSRSGKVGAPIQVGHDVDAIVATPRGLWVTTFSGVLALINPVRAAVVRRIRFRNALNGITYFKRRLFVSNYSAGKVLELDPATGRTLGRMSVGSQPRDLVAVGASLWVVEQGSSDVRRLALP
jgi:YVTN family beta-propeller protein